MLKRIEQASDYKEHAIRYAIDNVVAIDETNKRILFETRGRSRNGLDTFILCQYEDDPTACTSHKRIISPRLARIKAFWLGEAIDKLNNRFA